MDNPLVSIIIPTYNRCYIIGETLDCILAQTYTNWECIVIDDSSIDNTKLLLKFYSEKDGRIKFHIRPNDIRNGASSCRNYGLKHAKGDYIQYLDSDDLLHKDKLSEQLKVLSGSHPLTLTSCRWGSFINSSSLRIKTNYNSYKNFKRSIDLLYTFGKFNEYFPSHVYLISKELIALTENWNENLTYNDDGEYFTRIITNAKEIRFCENAEAYYRAGNKNRLSILNSESKIVSCIISWNLIKDNLDKQHQNISKVYVKNGKRNVYYLIKDLRPDLVENFSDFFEDVIPFKTRFTNFFNI